MIIIVCTLEVFSYPNSRITSGLMEPHTDFVSMSWGGGRVAVGVLRPIWPHNELATMASRGSSSEFACCVCILVCYTVLVHIRHLVVRVDSITVTS